MSTYYYFASTLPTPQLGAPPPMSSEEFLARCRRHLGAADLAAVVAAGLVSPPAGPAPATASSTLLVCYYAWERSVRNELVRLRARTLGRPAEPWVRPAGLDDTASRAAQSAFGAATPLEAELLLERLRWDEVQSLKTLHSFDLEVIAAYRLELQILERLARFRQELGEERYRELYAAILEAAEPVSGVQT